MNTEARNILNQVVELRKTGALQEALPKFSELFNHYSHNGEILVEGIILSLLSRQNEQAYQLYLQLKQLPDAVRFWKPEFLARLKLAMPEHPIPETDLIETGHSAAWIAEYLTNGSEPVYPVSIKAYSLQCPFGAVTFTFTGCCPSCNSDYRFAVHQNILVSREFLCPVCLASQRVDYEIIKGFLAEKFASPAVPHLEMPAVDRTLYEMRVPFNVDTRLGGEEVPLYCKSIGLEYFSLLVQFTVNRLFTQ
jgi:hypothetical protein